MAEQPVHDVTGSDDILVNDPLNSFLGPMSGNKVLGNYQEEDIPDEVLGILDEYKLYNGKPFRTIIKELPEGCDDPALGAFVKSFSKTVPTIDYLGRNYGPGRYCLVFTWKQKDPEQGRMISKSSDVLIEVSDKYEAEYREFQHQQKIARLKKRKESVQDALLESKLEGTLLEDQTGEHHGNQNAKEYVKEMLAFNEQLGLKRGGIDWEKLMPLLMTGMPLMLKVLADMSSSKQAQMQQMMTLMLTQSNNYNSQLVEVMKNMGPQNGSDTMKEFREMLTSAIDMKELLQPNKPDSLADKIFSMLETVGPQLLQIAQMSAAARARDPRIAMAKQFVEHNPDFQALDNSPESKAALVRKLDTFYGWQQTDAILQVMGWTRPDNCPRIDEQKFPAGAAPSPGANPGETEE